VCPQRARRDSSKARFIQQARQQRVSGQHHQREKTQLQTQEEQHPVRHGRGQERGGVGKLRGEYRVAYLDIEPARRNGRVMQRAAVRP